MTPKQYARCLQVPTGKVDVVIDTDTYNEIDDQFAVSYLIRSPEKLHTVALYAAPFYNSNSTGPADGMEKSYAELLKLLRFAGADELTAVTFRGADRYLPDESTPVPSDAVRDLVARSRAYSADHPLYVVAIGAITNIASALLTDPTLKERIVVVWLGGHARHIEEKPASEFNMTQDIAAARVVMGCGVPFVQLPCCGVVSEFAVSPAELNYWLRGKNPLADYLARHSIEAEEKDADSYSSPWTRVIWDVTAVGWLLNDGNRFMRSRTVPVYLPAYDRSYESTPQPRDMTYVYLIERNALMDDLFRKLRQ